MIKVTGTFEFMKLNSKADSNRVLGEVQFSKPFHSDPETPDLIGRVYLSTDEANYPKLIAAVAEATSRGKPVIAEGEVVGQTHLHLKSLKPVE